VCQISLKSKPLGVIFEKKLPIWHRMTQAIWFEKMLFGFLVVLAKKSCLIIFKNLFALRLTFWVVQFFDIY